jgi:predicted metal-dependent peptidase
MTTAAPTTERRIEASRLRLSATHPFFASLLLMAPVVITDDVPTAATNGKRIAFNPAFVAPLTSAQLDGLVVHELLHCALLHPVRRGTRDPFLWNIAADIHINGMIRTMKHLDLPPGGVEAPKLAHLSVDEIYAALLRSDKVREKLKQDFALHDLAPPDDETQDEIDRLGAFWADALQRARVAASMHGGTGAAMGTGAAVIDRLVDATHAPRLDWRSALWRHVVRTPDDFAGFDRRHLWQGLYVEELEGQGLDVDVCVDTSGSVDHEQLRDFLSELRGILRAYPSVRCRLYYADAACRGPYEVDADRPLPVAKGGGGTDFRPFFEATAEGAAGAAGFALHSGAPRLAIYLTDGHGAFPGGAPDRPVVWVVTPGGLASERFPFGEVVRMISGG